MARRVTIIWNGLRREVEIEDNETLLDVLRYKIKDMSVKAGCWKGECGLCTVELNGRLVKSCLVLAAEADGAEVITAAGLAKDGRLTPIQRAFIEYNAFQCGFCTPAFVVAAHNFLRRNPNPTREEIKKFLSAVLCRCTGYVQIVKAVEEAAKYYRQG